MRFSMLSYLLGVGTVVGALTLGFGGGVLLTKTAIKDSASGPSRIERAARAEPAAPQVQVTEARAVPVPRADAPAVQPPEPVRQIQETPVQAVAESKPVSEVKPVAEAAMPEPAKPVEPVRQADAPRQEQPVRQAEAPKQVEKQVEQPKHIEQKETGQAAAAREQRRAERRMQRERQLVAERKARATETVRTRVRVVEEPARPELAFEREEPRPGLFEGLFGRPQDAAPDER